MKTAISLKLNLYMMPVENVIAMRCVFTKM